MFVKAVVASLLAAQLAFATTCTRSYTVQAGDYCDKISAAQSVSTYQLAALNPGINGGCTNLLPGQVLCLGSSDADCTSVAVVKPGNTCDIISQAANTNNTLLHLNNPQINQGCTNIYVGEVLCVAGSSQVPPAPANVVPAQQVGGGNTPVPQNQGNDNNNGGNNNNNNNNGGNNNNNNGGGNNSNNNNGGDNGNNGDNSDGGDDSQLPFCDEIDN